MISVITASLPDRAGMLAECIASVGSQTLPAGEHLIAVDHAHRGPAALRTELAQAAGGEWIAVVDDDDVLLPNHLATLAGADADIVYTYCTVEGRDWNPNQPFDPDELRRRSYIPATALLRASLVAQLGGWRPDAECVNRWEDWDFYLRALDLGASFACIPEITWRYRFHGSNRSRK